jgi:hypothetical protein
MFADAKGYLVTEMVWEEVEVSDSEVSPVKAIKSNTSNSTNKRPIETEADDEKDGELVIKKGGGAKVPVKKVAKKAAPVVQQKGMMSFFGKK